MSNLLPPNATKLEKNIEQLGQRITNLPVPFVELHRVEQCLIPFLAWLAWDHRVEYWQSDWGEFEKRQAITESKTFNAQRGTRSSIESLLSKFVTNFQLKAWHEYSPPKPPFTFIVMIDPIITVDQFAQIQTAVEATKSARDIYTVSATVLSTAQIQIVGICYSSTTSYLKSE